MEEKAGMRKFTFRCGLCGAEPAYVLAGGRLYPLNQLDFTYFGIYGFICRRCARKLKRFGVREVKPWRR